MDSTHSGERRHRAPRKDVGLARAALEVVRPIHHRIGPWQASAARLLSVGERIRRTGSPSPGDAAEVEALMNAVNEQRRRIAAEASLLPLNVARHGRIEDTRRALDSVAAVLTEAGKLLGAGTP